MEQFLGIDLGTQGVKVAGWDEEGNFLGSTSREYPIITPQTGFAEQNPETWWEKTKRSNKRISKLYSSSKCQSHWFFWSDAWNSNHR